MKKVGFMKKDGKATKTDGWIYSALGPDGLPKEIDPAKYRLTRIRRRG